MPLLLSALHRLPRMMSLIRPIQGLFDPQNDYRDLPRDRRPRQLYSDLDSGD